MSTSAPESHDNRLRMDGPLARRHNACTVGTGPAIAVFAHGLGTDQNAWQRIAAKLPDECTGVFFDMPGTSPLLPANFDPDRYRTLAPFADDLLALLEETGVERCAYIGHSVAGMIGVLAAIEEPRRFDRLALINASPRYIDDDGYRGGMKRDDVDGLLAAMANDYQAWVAGFAPAAIGVDVPEAIEEFSTCLRAMRPDVMLRVARTIFESDVRALLPELRVPTMLIHSSADIVVPPDVGRYLNDHIAGSTLVWIDAEGHLPHVSDPAAVGSALRGLLAA